jgi:phosphatidylserine/phosphatidylglycerophosphate/cardiolipin synthase-like enzyme
VEIAMPSVVVPRALPGAAAAAPSLDLALAQRVDRRCRLEGYEKISVGSVTVDDEIVAYASPDSTFAVTKRLIDGAKKSILIGIYDFSAPHVKELVLQALARGVKVGLMLDIDGNSEQRLFDELASLGVEAVPAPSCASQNDNKFFRSSHEKVVVIDKEWTLVQSGNYSSNSCPLNTIDGGDPSAFVPGNRDMGIAVKSKKLATFFDKVLRSDMKLELKGPTVALGRFAEADTILVERAPTRPPSKLHRSKTHKLTAPLKIQPVLTPDNYMSVVPGLLRAAKKSILIQQQYIRATQDKIEDLIAAMKYAKSKNGGLDIRIMLGKLFDEEDLEPARKMLARLKSELGLKLGKHIRYVNTTRLVHCHNKTILIDDKGVLVGSQNWSKAAVSENREAALWFEHKAICGYYKEIFETDWKDGFRKLPTFGPETIAADALRAGGYLQVQAGDYAEV